MMASCRRTRQFLFLFVLLMISQQQGSASSIDDEDSSSSDGDNDSTSSSSLPSSFTTSASTDTRETTRKRRKRTGRSSQRRAAKKMMEKREAFTSAPVQSPSLNNNDSDNGSPSKIIVLRPSLRVSQSENEGADASTSTTASVSSSDKTTSTTSSSPPIMVLRPSMTTTTTAISDNDDHSRTIYDDESSTPVISPPTTMVIRQPSVRIIPDYRPTIVLRPSITTTTIISDNNENSYNGEKTSEPVLSPPTTMVIRPPSVRIIPDYRPTTTTTGAAPIASTTTSPSPLPLIRRPSSSSATPTDSTIAPTPSTTASNDDDNNNNNNNIPTAMPSVLETTTTLPTETPTSFAWAWEQQHFWHLTSSTTTDAASPTLFVGTAAAATATFVPTTTAQTSPTAVETPGTSRSPSAAPTIEATTKTTPSNSPLAITGEPTAVATAIPTVESSTTAGNVNKAQPSPPLLDDEIVITPTTISDDNGACFNALEKGGMIMAAISESCRNPLIGDESNGNENDSNHRSRFLADYDTALNDTDGGNSRICEDASFVNSLTNLLFPLRRRIQKRTNSPSDSANDNDEKFYYVRDCISTAAQLVEHIQVLQSRVITLCPCAHIFLSENETNATTINEASSTISIDSATFHLACGGLQCVLDFAPSEASSQKPYWYPQVVGPMFQSHGGHDVVFSNIVFRNGYTSVVNNSGNNTSSSELSNTGGAVADFQGGASTFIGCTFDGNYVMFEDNDDDDEYEPLINQTRPMFGGTIVARDDEQVTFDDCVFANNLAVVEPSHSFSSAVGAFVCDDCQSAVISNTRFINSTILETFVEDNVTYARESTTSQHLYSNEADAIQCQDVTMDSVTDILLPDGSSQYCGRLITPVQIFADEAIP